MRRRRPRARPTAARTRAGTAHPLCPGRPGRARRRPRGRLPLVPAPASLTFPAMEVDEAIRSRRTHKAFRPEPVDREVLDELFDLARWAPNHHLTNPWRFRVLGPQGARAAEGRRRPGGGGEARPRPDPGRLLGGAQRASPSRTRRTCWRPASRRSSSSPPPTPGASPATGERPRSCASREGRAAVGIGPSERFVGLIHLGKPVQDQRAPAREPAESVVEYLD